MPCSFGLLLLPRSGAVHPSQRSMCSDRDCPVDTARARSLWHAGGTIGEDDDGSQGRVADLAAEGHLDALSADPDPAAPRRHRSRAALAGADPPWYRPLAMRQWLLQRQPGLVARLRVDTGATGALQPSSAALER